MGGIRVAPSDSQGYKVGLDPFSLRVGVSLPVFNGLLYGGDMAPDVKQDGAAPLRVGVTGGRDYDSWHAVTHALRQMPEDATLVHGAASGADSQCAEWWDMHGRKCDPHPADWTAPCRDTCKPGHRRTRPDGTTYCPAAGGYRNQEMVDSGIDILIAFPGGRGTADMTERAEAAGVPIIRMPV